MGWRHACSPDDLYCKRHRYNYLQFILCSTHCIWPISYTENGCFVFSYKRILWWCCSYVLRNFSQRHKHKRVLNPTAATVISAASWHKTWLTHNCSLFADDFSFIIMTWRMWMRWSKCLQAFRCFFFIYFYSVIIRIHTMLIKMCIIVLSSFVLFKRDNKNVTPETQTNGIRW